ncbi:MAG: hypothetical protein H7840_13950 [Alphaproteobacteria bacterium]
MDNGRKRCAETASAAEPVIVAIDVEWTQDPTKKRRNRVLAYAFTVRQGERTISLVIQPTGPKLSQRIRLGSGLGKALEKAIAENVIREWPEKVVVVGHYMRGDLAAFSDFSDLKAKVGSVRGTFASTRSPVMVDVAKSGDGVPEEVRVPKSRRVNAWDCCQNAHPMQVVFYDIYLLAPAGKSLGDIGVLVGREKLELPEGFDKSRMDLFLKREPELFEEYLVRDSEIPALYFQRFSALCQGELGIKGVPVTLGGCAVAMFRGMLAELKGPDGEPLDFDRLFGLSKRKARSYSPKTGRFRTVRVVEQTIARKTFEPLLAEGYHGGRTETFETGPSPVGEYSDLDLKSAYPTAMVMIRVLDYDAAFLSTAPEDFGADVLGVAEVKFSHPPGIRFPVFGVRTEHGLVFPMRGRTVTTAPEIAAALRLGVDVRIVRGVIMPWAGGDVRPFEVFVKRTLELRDRLRRRDGQEAGAAAPKDTLESLVAKTISNSLYGKTAQAVRPRTVLDTTTGGSKPLSGSAVSNAAFAAITTGLVRAVVAELLNGIPPGRRVISVSTDGFLADVSIDDLRMDGPACRVLAECRERLTGDPGILECKRRVAQVVTPRNRAAFTAVGILGSEPVIARGGIKLPVGVADPSEYLLGLYLNRTADAKVERTDLISLRDQYREDADLVSIAKEVRLNLEPDHKRRLVGARMEEIRGGRHEGARHVATSSEPHDTAEAMVEVRTLFEGWRHSSGRCLRTMEDWDDWEDYLQSSLAARESGRRAYRTAGGASDDLKRQALRALTREMWGMSLRDRSYAGIAEWLTQAGFRTSVSSVKNARRSDDPVSNSIAATERSLTLLGVFVDEFPDFDFESAFVHGHLETVREHLAKRKRKS